VFVVCREGVGFASLARRGRRQTKRVVNKGRDDESCAKGWSRFEEQPGSSTEAAADTEPGSKQFVCCRRDPADDAVCFSVIYPLHYKGLDG
jgi:hypothetical protein